MSNQTAAQAWSLWSVECRLVVTDPRALAQARALVDAELDRIERACSRFRPDSELMTLVREADGVATLGPVLADLVAVALDAARQTDGAVDPTLGSVLVGLGYDRDLDLVRAGSPASPERPAGSTRTPVVVIRRAEAWRALHLDGDRLQLPAGTQLDLGATAKARAADRCAALVHDRLGTGVLVSLGGDIATAGPAPEGGWQVTVQDQPSDVPQQVTLSAGAAVATSSTSRRTWTQGGEHRHHLIDPRTGLPARSPWRSATVVAPTALAANTATTAALVKGPDALAWLESTGLPARLVSHEGRPVRVGGWPREVAA